jgi:2-polyprenyl-3-methyl-5-hydroxy-6-metoxy-1,4-benzoquinol methylase
MPYHYGRDYHKAITISGEAGLDKRWRYPRNRISEFAQGGALLDIGCSSGGFLRTLAGPAWELYGIEVSPTEAQKAEASTGAKVFVGDILDAPFSASTFDVITGFHVLEHVYQPKQVVGKLWEWLKPGGILYLHVPNIHALEARIFQSYWYGLELPRHLYHFSPASLSRLFAFFDFEEVILRTLSHNHIEASMHYILGEVQAKLGVSRTPLAAIHKSPGIAWRIVRKALRLGLLEPLGCVAAAVGHGAGIEAMYRKRASGKRSGVK